MDSDDIKYKTTIEDEHWRNEEFQWTRILANRLGHLLTTMRNNDLDSLEGASELTKILESVESAPTIGALADLAEELHATGHTLLDALERS